MKIHEYQAKDLLRRFKIAVPDGRVAETPEEARLIAQEIGGGRVVVKAQIHAGGRGKGGGIKLADDPDQAAARADDILGMMLRTPQTGPAGQLVRKVLVEQATDVAREIYLAMTLDRETRRVTVIASAEGGMDIEEVAAKHPEKILKERIDPTAGLMPYAGRKLAFALGLTGKQVGALVRILEGMYALYQARDCSLLEVNPLVVTTDGSLLALDAKVNFDDNGLFRHADVQEMRDPHEEDPRESEAARYGFSYIALGGNIGCMVNGAGLAMATMDVIKLEGGEPANFLDVGGGATAETVTRAFRVILGDAGVRAILVNIFGGIMRCDVIAEGVIAATRETGLSVPLVVRLQGTNVEEGRRLLRESGLQITTAEGLQEAAARVVAAAREAA
jgi:succinyl-CoA synthetase beta subunit